MSESKRSHHHHGEQVPNSDHQGHPPYWKRAHRDWKFWVALSLMLAAMIIYVMSENLAWRPRNQAQQSQSGVVRK
jgi:hypothetical protein